MALADLLKSKKIIADDLHGDHRTVAIDYVNRRVRALVAANASLADPEKRGDITAAATPGVATTLIVEMPKVKAAFAAIWKRVGDDAAKHKHLPIDSATLRKHVSDRPPARDARAMRRRLVLSIIYQAAAHDPPLADNVERLHRLCDRRLRIVERMLYDVGRNRARAWSRTQISGHPGGPWIDGLDRAFEYPRVPRAFFDKVCSAGADDVCAAPMTDWRLGDDRNILGPIQTNPTTTARWRPNPGEGYVLDYTPAAAGSPKAVEAINGLFATSRDYLARNLLYCDHTIHALHLEALVFAESKRQATPGDTSWLDGVVKSRPAGWLRLSHPLRSDGSDNPNPEQFLAGRDEPSFFEHVTVRVEDLQVGDHLIVYNHPAYQHATSDGAWRLENAVVVQTAPGLLVQGHGTRPLSIAAAKVAMLEYLRQFLDDRRADVRPLAYVRSSSANTVTVDSVARLQTGMRIEIVDAATEASLSLPPHLRVTAIDARNRIVRYTGTSVAATSKHIVRRRRVLQWGRKYEGLELGSSVDLLRRVPAASSDYAPEPRQRADWYVAWLATPAEDEIRKNPARAKFVKERQFVDYTVETDGADTKTVGWFPLYEPSRRGKANMRKAGKIAACQPVKVGPKQIAAWTWFVDPGAGKGLVPVIRPKIA